MIARLYKEGLTKPWHELDDKERELNAYRREYDLYQSQHELNQNRIEAFLSRHWLEVPSLLTLDSVTLESLLIDYGSPEQIAAGAEQAAKVMRRWGKSDLSSKKIEQVIHSAATTLGQPCIEAERRYLQALAEEMRHSRSQAKVQHPAQYGYRLLRPTNRALRVTTYPPYGRSSGCDMFSRRLFAIAVSAQ